jgi:cytochrome c-type biogenesis protein CcmE
VRRQADGVTVRRSDGHCKQPAVPYGYPPDLFKEGKGVIAQGQIGADGVFRAKEVPSQAR